jgi:N-methylhydantoinase A
MAPGQSAQGPAVITESETTVIVPSGFAAMMHADGTIEVTRSGNDKAGDAS